MLIDLNELNYKKSIKFNYKIEKDELLDKRIHDLKDAVVVGNIYENSNEEIIIEGNFRGFMLIDDAYTLEEIPYEFNIDFSENLEDIKENYLGCYKNTQNVLDLKQFLWQNIVLEVPIGYSIKKDAEQKGDGWELINDNKLNDEIDPRLKKLEDLLKGDD